MNNSTLLSIVWLVVPFAVSLGVFGAMRSRGSRGFMAGCASILAGVFTSFVIGLLVLASVVW